MLQLLVLQLLLLPASVIDGGDVVGCPGHPAGVDVVSWMLALLGGVCIAVAPGLHLVFCHLVLVPLLS